MSQPSRMHVAVVGYGAEGRDVAMRLRSAGHAVSAGMLPAGSSWIRARKDGFSPAAVGPAVRGADVVVVLVPDADQPSVYWRAIAPNLQPGALVVFARGFALQAGTIEPTDVDVVLVAREGVGSDRLDRPREEWPRGVLRVAVHHDASGHALERAIVFARAAFGDSAPIGTTTVAEEFDVELGDAVRGAGGAEALLAQLDRAISGAQSHEPDEARISYLEGLRKAVTARVRGAA
jgi:ketol-acid reductoisomerase